MDMYRISPEVFARGPVVGNGLGGFAVAARRLGHTRLARSPHSWYIQVFTEMGLVGAAGFAWLTLAVVLGLWRAHRIACGWDGAMATALLASTAALAVVCAFQKPFTDNELILPLYFAGVGLALGVAPVAAAGRRAGQPFLALLRRPAPSREG